VLHCLIGRGRPERRSVAQRRRQPRVGHSTRLALQITTPVGAARQEVALRLLRLVSPT
jgi:hypothetical protein